MAALCYLIRRTPGTAAAFGTERCRAAIVGTCGGTGVIKGNCRAGARIFIGYFPLRTYQTRIILYPKFTALARKDLNCRRCNVISVIRSWIARDFQVVGAIDNGNITGKILRGRKYHRILGCAGIVSDLIRAVAVYDLQ